MKFSVLTGVDQVESDIKAAVWACVLELEKGKIHADLVDRFPRLSELFEDAVGQGGDKLTDEEARMVLQKIFDLCARVTTADKDRCGRDLDRLLDTCYRFRGSRSFKNFLKAVQSRRQLVQMIEKLGRYKTASNALVQAAKRFPEVFLHVDVEAVPTLPPLDAKAAGGYRGVYIGDVTRDLTHNTEHMCMSRLRTITDLTSEKLATKYQELCQSVPTAHAELQLVKFYEENADVDRPTFIGCSKKACYLCGLFLQLQGRFTVSKAHQNIYHTWTVPTIRCASPENAVMLDFVVEKMSRIIEDSCKKMLWENPKPEDMHKSLVASPPMSPGFPTPRSPLSPLSPTFSRPGTAASGIYSNLQNIRAAVQQLPYVSSKVTDSSGDSTGPESRSPNLSSASSRTSVSEITPVETKKQQPRRKPVVPEPIERMPTVLAADAPPVPPRSASRQAKDASARPGSARSFRKRASPVEVPKPQPTTDESVSSFTRSQSVRAPRKAAPSPTPVRTIPPRAPSVTRKPIAAPETPARAGRARSSSVMSRKPAPAPASPESVSPRTVSHPFGPPRRVNTAPSAIPVPRSVSRSNRKATPAPSPPRSPSASRTLRKPSPSRTEPEAPPSPTHITRSLRRSSPISIARFETAMAMAVTPVTGSPTMVDLPFKTSPAMVDLPAFKAVEAPKTGEAPSASAPAPAVETADAAAGLGLKKSQTPPNEERPTSMLVETANSPRPPRSLSERRGRPLKRVEPAAAGKRPRSPATDERKKAAIARAAAAAVQENGFAAQRARGLPTSIQECGLEAQRKRGLARGELLPKNYYSDTETLRTKLRGGALSSGSSSRSRIPKMTNAAETEYTLYLAGPDHDDKTLGEKIFTGRLSDGGAMIPEVKQRVGCRLRTQLRPAEKEIAGMRVKEVAKSLEEMVLDIFFPDAVLRLEVMWDGV